MGGQRTGAEKEAEVRRYELRRLFGLVRCFARVRELPLYVSKDEDGVFQLTTVKTSKPHPFLCAYDAERGYKTACRGLRWPGVVVMAPTQYSQWGTGFNADAPIEEKPVPHVFTERGT